MTPVEDTGAQGRAAGEASKSVAHTANSNVAAGRAATSASAKHGGQAQRNQEQGKEVPWVPGQAGLHRIYWDLRADGPIRWGSALEFLKGPESGALLPPGTYTATLRIGGQTASQSFTMVNDPDSHASVQEMQDRYQVTEAVLHEISQLDVALNRLHAIEGQVRALEAAVKGSPDENAVATAAQSLAKASQAVEAKITSNPGALESSLRVPDEIHEHLQALDALLEGEDDAPTAAVLQQKALLDPEYRAAVRAYDDFLASSVASFNQAMAARHLTGVIPGATLTP
jgi:DNA-binding FrmR family transcriptional regulator